MRNQLIKSKRYGKSVEIIYMSNCRAISKRRIKVLQVHGDSFSAYCYLRNAKRIFRINHVLALVPVYEKESRVI